MEITFITVIFVLILHCLITLGTMRKTLLTLSVAILVTVLFVSCEDEEKYAADGKQAAIEFCNCLDAGNSKDDCEAALTDKYSKAEYTSDEFINAFNEEGESCGVSITKIYTKDRVSVIQYAE